MKKESGVKEKYLNEIYFNVLKAIIIVVYFLALNLAYENVTREHLQVGINILTMVFVFVSIYIFEKAYKKDDGKLAIQGIEILILAAYTLTTEHITKKFDFNFKSYSLVASYISAIYFILKSIIIYTKGRKAVVEEFSDIREIVQKKEPIKKEATKKVKKENIINEKVDFAVEIENKPIQKKKKKVTDASTPRNVEERKTTSTTKKRPPQGKKPTNRVEGTKTGERGKKPAEMPKKKKTSNTGNRVSKENFDERPKRKKVKKEGTEND